MTFELLTSYCRQVIEKMTRQRLKLVRCGVKYDNNNEVQTENMKATILKFKPVSWT